MPAISWPATAGRCADRRAPDGPVVPIRPAWGTPCGRHVVRPAPGIPAVMPRAPDQDPRLFRCGCPMRPEHMKSAALQARGGGPHVWRPGSDQAENDRAEKGEGGADQGDINVPGEDHRGSPWGLGPAASALGGSTGNDGARVGRRSGEAKPRDCRDRRSTERPCSRGGIRGNVIPGPVRDAASRLWSTPSGARTGQPAGAC